jgi:hypothetical protein
MAIPERAKTAIIEGQVMDYSLMPAAVRRILISSMDHAQNAIPPALSMVKRKSSWSWLGLLVSTLSSIATKRPSLVQAMISETPFRLLLLQYFLARI